MDASLGFGGSALDGDESVSRGREGVAVLSTVTSAVGRVHLP